jgi:TRAP transporter TAXI family solute receptor
MKDFLKVYTPIALLIVAGFVVTYQFIDPAPPHHLRMAAGAPGGAYAAFAKRYQAALAQNGITLDIVNSAGSVENLALLSAPQSGVDVAFVQGGTGDPAASPDLRSIASLYYEPVWLFVRGTAPERLSALRGKRIAIGVEGSGTRAAALMLLAANGVDGGNASLVTLGGKDAAAALRSGRIDALFNVGAARDPVIDDLMQTPGINLVDFTQAQAYSRQFRFLSVVTLPRGLINLDKDVPAHDYHLVAPAAALVARSNLHPALVDLFIAATTDIHGQGQDFERPGEFPSELHLDFPLSKEAARVLANGPTFLRRYLPFWAAILVERLWILILPLITLTIPLLRIAPPTYRWQIQRKILRRYRELRTIEAKARETRDPGARQVLLGEVETLQTAAARLHLPLGFAGDLYQLRQDIDYVKRGLAQEAPRATEPGAMSLHVDKSHSVRL